MQSKSTLELGCSPKPWWQRTAGHWPGKSSREESVAFPVPSSLCSKHWNTLGPNYNSVSTATWTRAATEAPLHRPDGHSPSLSCTDTHNSTYAATCRLFRVHISYTVTITATHTAHGHPCSALQQYHKYTDSSIESHGHGPHATDTQAVESHLQTYISHVCRYKYLAKHILLWSPINMQMQVHNLSLQMRDLNNIISQS